MAVSARLFGASFCLINVGAMPVANRLTRLFWRWTARNARYRSYRDAYSRRAASGLGIDVMGDRAYPDLAFALPVPKKNETSATSGRTVAVGVMSYVDRAQESDAERIRAAYFQQMSDLLGGLVDRGYRVDLTVGDKGDLTAARHLLGEFISRPQALQNVGSVRVVEPDSLDRLIRDIAQADFVVATRFHSIVCAIKLGKPTISIGYAPKNDSLMRDVGLEDYSLDIRSLSAQTVLARFDRLVTERYELRVAERVQCYESDLADQLAELSDLLSSPATRHARTSIGGRP